MDSFTYVYCVIKELFECIASFDAYNYSEALERFVFLLPFPGEGRKRKGLSGLPSMFAVFRAVGREQSEGAYFQVVWVRFSKSG